MIDHAAAAEPAPGSRPDGVAAADRSAARSQRPQSPGHPAAEPSWPTLQTFALVRVLVSTALLLAVMMVRP